MDAICSYCRENKITTVLGAEKIVKKMIVKKKKLNQLKTLIRISPEIDNYVINHYPQIYVLLKTECMVNDNNNSFLIKNYLVDNTKNNTMYIACNYCEGEACEFHVKNGDFNFYKCSNKECNVNTSICGWCKQHNNIDQLKLCDTCYDNYTYEYLSTIDLLIC